MAENTSADAAVLPMPYEGREMSVEEAANSLLGADSHEEPTDEEQEAEEAEPVAESDEDTETEESTDEDAEPSEGDGESDTTPEGSQEPDARLAEREKQLTADYTRKTQEVAEQRKRAEAVLAEAAERRDSYAQRLADVEAVLAANAPAEPDWAALRQSDPAEYAAQWADHQQRAQQLAAVQAERQRIADEQAAEWQESLRARLAEESAKLLAAIPEWQDTEKAGTEKKALMDYAKSSLGFTDEDLGGVTDHRLVVLLRKAAKYDELTTKTREQVEAKKKDAPKVLAPGSRDNSPKSSVNVGAKIAFDKLKRSGSVEDAAALFLAQSTGGKRR